MKKLNLAVLGLAGIGAVAVAQAPVTRPAPPAARPAAGPVANPRVMMLRLFVADLDRGERFYQAVFGMTTVQRMGENVRIMIFPGGTLPGIIMIKSPQEATMNGSFVMQVSDLQATMSRAAANGGKPMNTRFAQQVEGMSARSSHFVDPDGNVIEVLQMGGSSK